VIQLLFVLGALSQGQSLEATFIGNEAIAVTAIPTAHANVEHYSYRVDWNGLSLYFVGDTDDPTALLAQRGVTWRW
jgi:hypothetical protein